MKLLIKFQRKYQMNKCLNCGAEIVQKEGARERKFCENQNKCKQAYHNKHKKPQKFVRKDKYDKVVEELVKIKEMIKDKQPPSVDAYKTSDSSVEARKYVAPKKHKLWKEGDPPEKTNAFFLRYGVFSYDEIEK